jgi:rod shape-determining protein MreB
MAIANAAVALPGESGFSRIFELTKKFFYGADLAMDLGTANTLLYVKGKGIVLAEPSVIAIDNNSGEVIAVGSKAKSLFGKTSKNIRVLRPMKDGVISDSKACQGMISHFLSTVKPPRGIRRPLLVVGVPSEITQVEKRAVIEAGQACGVERVILIEEPMAAALGAGLPVRSRSASLVVDIGGGTTDVAIIGSGSTHSSMCIRVAGDEMDEAVQRALQKEFGLKVGIFDAERIKIALGSCQGSCANARSIEVSGIDICQSIPRSLEISGNFLQQALAETVHAITSAVQATLEQCSPDISQDLLKNGGVLTGGGAQLPGLAAYLSSVTGIKFRLAEDPLNSVVQGVASVIENLKDNRSLCIC